MGYLARARRQGFVIGAVDIPLDPSRHDFSSPWWRSAKSIIDEISSGWFCIKPCMDSSGQWKNQGQHGTAKQALASTHRFADAPVNTAGLLQPFMIVAMFLSPMPPADRVAAVTFKPSRSLPSTRDARALAAQRLPRLIYDFIDGGAGDELGLASNLSDLQRVRLQPRSLAEVNSISLKHRYWGAIGMCRLASPPWACVTWPGPAPTTAWPP